MSLATLSSGRIAFDKASIMRRAYEHGRFPLQLCRARRVPASERNRILSRALTKAWREARAEAVSLARRIEADAAVRRDLAARAAEAVALAGRYGNDPAAIRWEIERENYRQHFNPGRIDTLRAALSTLGA